MTKEFNLFNVWHLGDNIFTIHYLNKFINHEYIFNYYVRPEYIEELKKHIKNEKIKLFSLSVGVPQNSFNMWIGDNRFYWEYIVKNKYMYDLFFVDFYKMVSSKLGIESKINKNYDMLFDNSNYQVDLNREYDFLIINSLPMSQQFNYNENDFINLCDFLNKKNISFITTKKIKNYDCTLDQKMSIVDIGNLSNYCSNIVGVNTAPIITTFTEQNIDKIDKRFILDKVLNFSYNERIYRLDNLNLIYNYL